MMDEKDIIKLAETEARSKSNTKRIDELEKRQANLETLASSVQVMANEMEHVKKDVVEIKDGIKTIAEKPAKNWNKVVDIILSVIVTALITYILTGVGLK